MAKNEGGPPTSTEPVSPEKIVEDLGTLTEEEEGELAMLQELMGLMREADSPGREEQESFFVEFQRLTYLMTHALDELRDTDQAIYLKIVSAARMDYQEFLDAINAATAADPTMDTMRAEHFMEDPADLSFSGLFTTDGFQMRARLISWLQDKPQAAKVRRILERLQVVLPEVSGDVDF